jgi:hypothetical protein
MTFHAMRAAGTGHSQGVSEVLMGNALGVRWG